MLGTTGHLFWLLLATPSAIVAGSPQHVEAKEPVAKEIVRIEKGAVAFSALSPDDKTLAYAEVDDPHKPDARSALILMDVATGKELKRSPPQRGGPNDGALSRDGKLLVFGPWTRDGRPFLWEVDHWKQGLLLELLEKHRFASPLAFSPDTKIIAGLSGPQSMGGGLVIWDVATGKCRPLLKKEEQQEAKLPAPRHRFGHAPEGDAYPIKAARFTEDESRFLFVEHHGPWGPSATVIWDVVGGQRTKYLPGGWWWLRTCRLTPRGQALVLPSYGEFSPLSVAPNEDGTISLAVTPHGKHFGMPVRYPAVPFQELCRLDEFKGGRLQSCVLSRDGKTLLAIGTKPRNMKKEWIDTLLAWDVSEVYTAAAKEIKGPSREERDNLWASLFEVNPEPYEETAKTLRIHRAMISLVANPKEAAPYLRDKVGPPADAQRIAGLIIDLDSEEFSTRDKASRDLERLEHAAGPFLREALTKKPSAEQKARLERLLAKLEPTAAAYELRWLRVLDILEHVNTPEARELLETIAKGGYGPSFAEEAKKALKRTGQKP